MHLTPSSAYPSLAQQANPLGLADFSRHEQAWHRAQAVLRNLNGHMQEAFAFSHPCATPKLLYDLHTGITGLFPAQERDKETLKPHVTKQANSVWEICLPAGYDLRNLDNAHLQQEPASPLGKVGDVSWPAQEIEPILRHCLAANLPTECAAFMHAVQVSARYERTGNGLGMGYDLRITLDASMPFACYLASLLRYNPHDLHALDFDTLLQHIHAPEAGVEYPDDAFLRYRVTALVDALAWSGPPGQDPIADTLRENLTVGAWCLAVAEYAAWMPQH